MVWKEVPAGDAGTADKFGGDDVNKYSKLFKGEDVDDVLIGVDWKFNKEFDLNKIVAPTSPAANTGRIYVKEIDSNNDGVFCKIKKAGVFVEVQIL